MWRGTIWQNLHYAHTVFLRAFLGPWNSCVEIPDPEFSHSYQSETLNVCTAADWKHLSGSILKRFAALDSLLWNTQLVMSVFPNTAGSSLFQISLLYCCICFYWWRIQNFKEMWNGFRHSIEPCSAVGNRKNFRVSEACVQICRIEGKPA